VRALSASELLGVWERGLQADPIKRAMELLSEACPDMDGDSLSGLTIGQRDGLLLRLREWTFGPQVTALAVCTACGEQIELSFRSADLQGPEPEPEASLALDGFTLHLRPPTTRDLAAASHPDLARARVELLERCVLAARYLETPVEAGQLPDALLDAAERRLAEADPQADISVAVTCPACEARCAVQFDVVSYFWREIEAWAVRMLRDVHTLATAYGWSEGEILALSPLRRQCYLDLVGT